MKIISTTRIFTAGLLVAIAFPIFAADTSDKILLPEEFKIYVNEDIGISSHPFKEGKLKILPTSNMFKDVPGCYVACYSKNNQEGVFPVNKGVYLMGQIRVGGRYTNGKNGICIPKGYEDKAMRTATEFKEKCEIAFPTKCANKSCWVGGQTANWF